jgi:hypothetical protein
MKGAAECRKQAELCVRLAATAKQQHRKLLLEIAQKWLRLADQASTYDALVRQEGTQEASIEAAMPTRRDRRRDETKLH